MPATPKFYHHKGGDNDKTYRHYLFIITYMTMPMTMAMVVSLMLYMHLATYGTAMTSLIRKLWMVVRMGLGHTKLPFHAYSVAFSILIIAY